MGFPVYDTAKLLRAGTDPGIVSAHKKPKIPSCANRPLLSSAIKRRSLVSADIFLLKPNGSTQGRDYNKASEQKESVHRHLCCARKM
jgi:hypothetical protein